MSDTHLLRHRIIGNVDVDHLSLRQQFGWQSVHVLLFASVGTVHCLEINVEFLA